MTQIGMFLFMTIFSLYLGIMHFKEQKDGFNPFKKYSKRQLKEFKKAEKIQELNKYE